VDFALVHPERDRALLLVAPALTGWEGSPALDALDEEEDRLLDAGKIDEAVALSVRTWLDGVREEPAPVPADVRERLSAMQRRAFETILAAYEAPTPPGPVAWSDPPARTRLGEVRAPTLVVIGAHDQPDFRVIGELLAREIPGAESITMDTAHLPALEAPDEFNRIALRFLRVYAAPDQGG
jgi:3-oxoadipate enol-lactonase